MCDYCGCREQPAIARLTRDHEEIMDLARVFEHTADPQSPAAAQQFAAFVSIVEAHSSREERGVYARLRSDPRSRDVVDTLEADHACVRELLRALVPGSPGSAEAFREVIGALRRHIDIEEYDLFPASLVYLVPEDWEALESANPEATAT